MKTAKRIAQILENYNNDPNDRYIAVNGKVCFDQYDHDFREWTTVKSYTPEELVEQAIKRAKNDAEKLWHVHSKDLAIIPLERWKEVAPVE